METQELLNEVEKITHRKYPKIQFNDTEDIEILADALEELLSFYGYLDDEFKRFRQDVEDNYKPMTKEEQIYG
jgi:hypothetical protein